MSESLGLTGLDPEVNGFLLDDGPGAREVGVADVVRVVVRGEDVGKVEIAVLTHRYPLILLDVQDLCGGRWGARKQRSGPHQGEVPAATFSPASSPSWAPTAVHPVDSERLGAGRRVARQDHRLPLLHLYRLHRLFRPLGGT